MGATLLVGFAWPMAVVAVTWFLLDVSHLRHPSARLFAGASLLVVISSLVVVPSRRKSMCARASVVGGGADIAKGFVAFVLLGVAARLPAEIVLSGFAWATYAVAYAEERVFRGRAPAWTTSILGRASVGPKGARIAAVIVSQLSFSAAHMFSANLESRGGAPEAARLFVVGLLYQATARACGLWAAAGAHGVLNLVLIASVDGFGPAPSVAIVTVCGGVAIAVLLGRHQR